MHSVSKVNGERREREGWPIVSRACLLRARWSHPSVFGNWNLRNNVSRFSFPANFTLQQLTMTVSQIAEMGMPQHLPTSSSFEGIPVSRVAFGEAVLCSR
jgi:hypothetical protein